jgi:hypothetical protein
LNAANPSRPAAACLLWHTDSVLQPGAILHETVSEVGAQGGEDGVN